MRGREREAAAGTGSRPDVLVVGGGVAGCALARELAGRGLRVLLLERGETGQEASAAAAGLLSPQSDCPRPGPLFDLLLSSRRLYRDWVQGLEEETSLSVGFRCTGLLKCAFDAEEEARLRDFLWQRERGLPIEWVEPGTLAERSGAGLSAEARAGVFFPEEGVVDPRRLMGALAASAASRGVDIRTQTPARRLVVEGGRCLGVETDRGFLEAGCVVDAAGAWAGFDRSLPLAIPVEPVRGQIVELALEPEAPRAVLQSEAVYLAPHGNGRVLVGSTLERVGFQKAVTAGAVQTLLEAAARVLPLVRAGRFVTAWAGLRPGTPDGLPILGGCGIDRLFFAAGYFRNGILLAPITAALVAERIMGAPTRHLEPFSVERFASSRPDVKTKARGPRISDRIEKITRGETR